MPQVRAALAGRRSGDVSGGYLCEVVGESLRTSRITSKFNELFCAGKVLTYRLDAVKTRRVARGDNSTFQLGECETVMASSMARQMRSRPCPVTAE